MPGVNPASGTADRLRRPIGWWCAVLFLLCLSAPLYAKEGWYLGADAGWSHVDIPPAFWIDSPGTTGSVQDSGVGYQFYGGYQLQKHFALEVGFVRAAGTRFSGFTDGVNSRWNAGPISGTSSVSGLRTSAVGIWPTGLGLQFYTKVGVLFFDTTTFYHRTINGIDRFNDDGGSGIVSLGLQSPPWHGWSLRGEWQYTAVHLEKRVNSAVHFLTLGVIHPIP